MLSRSSSVGRLALRACLRSSCSSRFNVQVVHYSSKRGFEKFYKAKKSNEPANPNISKERQSTPDEQETLPQQEELGNTSAAESPKESEKIVSDAELQAATTKAKATDDATTKAEATEEATMKAKTPDESRTKAKATDKDSKEEAKTNFSKKADPKKKKDQDKDDEDEEQDEEKNQRAMVGGVLLVLGAFTVFRLLRNSDGVADAAGEIDWDTCRNMLANREITQVKIVNNTTAVIITGTQRARTMSIASGSTFEKQLEMSQLEIGVPAEDHVPVTYERTNRGILLEVFINCLPAMFLFWFLKQSGSQMANMLGTKKKFSFTGAKKVKTTFSDVAGLEEAKREIEELVDFLKDPKKYQALGARIPKGCLLTGPPGVGKTLLAKATAGEAGVPFLNISGSDFVEIFVGVGPSRVRDMFKEARKKAPCIIFIDEIDAIGRSRKGGRAGGRNDERESTLNALLVEMDGFNTSSGVVVLAGTNRPDVLDKALLRPGRFDRQIALEAPPLADRIEIWMVHLKPITTDSSVSKEELAKGLATLSAGFSGADIMNACNEAALAAARLGAKEVCMEHFEKALDRIVGGLEKKNKVLSQWERKVVAHHEAGHAIVGWFSEWVDPLLKVSIQPRANGTLGFAQYLPKDKYIKTWRQIFEEMSMALGGRAAEKIVFDHLSTGASDDLQRVTKLAYAQVTKYGMSDEIGHVHFQQADDDDMVFNKPYSTKTEKAIDAVVRKLVDDAYDRTEKLLLEKKTELLAVAAALMEKEVLKTEDMVAILGERPSGMPDIYIAKKLKEAEEAAKSRREKEEGDAAEHEASASGAPEAAATPSPQ